MEETILQDEVPEEIDEHCVNCHHSLAAIDRILKPILSSNMAEIEDGDKVNLPNTLDRLGVNIW